MLLQSIQYDPIFVADNSAYDEAAWVFLNGAASGFTVTYGVSYFNSQISMDFAVVLSGNVYGGSGLDSGDFTPSTYWQPQLQAQTVLTNGNTIFVNYTYSNINVNQLSATIYNSAGDAVGGVFITTDPTGGGILVRQPDPAIESLAGGGIAMAWSDYATLPDGNNNGSAIKIRFSMAPTPQRLRKSW